MPKKYVIESDGTSQGTKIRVNGHEIKGATSVSFEMYSNNKEIDLKIHFHDKQEFPPKKIGF